MSAETTGAEPQSAEPQSAEPQSAEPQSAEPQSAAIQHLQIDAGPLAELHAHAQTGYPFEVVGILAGRGDHVTRITALVNEREPAQGEGAHNRYKVSGLVLMRAERALEAQGLEILGYYHSHPDHPAQYSETDRNLALPNLAYLITAVHDGRVVDTKIWRLRDDRSLMDPQLFQIIGAPMSDTTTIPNVTIHIPTPLRSYTGGNASVSVKAATVGDALGVLTSDHPALQKHLRNDNGSLRSFVNVYLGDEDIRFLNKEDTPLTEGAELTIVPSIAGGAQ